MASALVAQSLPLLSWFKLVNDTVTEPYLDEVFHVPQAQAYCNGNLDVWDPKITTPPGLYLLSYVLSPLIGCSLMALRGLNLFAMTLVPVVVIHIYRVRRVRGDDALSIHSALNVGLFPPLFFFSALYYTDVTSTISVLIFYWFFLYADRKGLRASAVPMILLGLASLFLRQTNIFWVAIFPAGLTFLKELDIGHQVVRDSMHRRAEGFGDSVLSVARTSYKMHVVYDMPVRDAWIEDYAKTLISIVACTVKTVTQRSPALRMIQALTPYFILLGLFGSFIIWNGGVVLGDKSNHVATLHLPQMLYIWCYLTFFSWPLLYPYLLALPMWLLANIPAFTQMETMLLFRRRQILARPWIVLVLVVLACLVIHFNTIVHPFTLADNRHYNFYVFRYLMRPFWVKYAVTPLYVVCGWSCVQTLGSRPFANPIRAMTQHPEMPSDKCDGDESTPRTKRIPDGDHPATTSFVLIWLATSTLQLITAPLVEPRYFILPWIFWRIHVPLHSSSAQPEATNSSSWQAWTRGLDHRLVLETLWLLCVNAATGYIFLYWGFGWPQEPEKVQRFMW